MFKVLLVDDEENVVELLKKLIDWESLGFVICSQARDGFEAIEKVRAYEPNVIIADICMPKMDGLKFSEKILKDYSNIKVILLTAYNLFDYARKAVNIGAYHFLLKPVDRKELEYILQKAAEEIRHEIEGTEEIDNLKRKIDLSEVIVKEKILNSIMTGKTNPSDNIKENLKLFGFNLYGDLFRVLAVEIDRKSELQYENDSVSNNLNRIKEIVRDVFMSRLNDEVFQGGDDRIYVIVGVTQNSGSFENSMNIICEKIRIRVEHTLGISVTIGIGAQYGGIENVYKSYCEAVMALKQKFTIGINRVITYSSNEASEDRKTYFPIDRRRDIIINLRINSYKGVEKIVSSIFKSYEKNNVSVKNVHIVCMELILAGITFLDENSCSIQDVCGNHFNPIEEMVNKETMEDMRDWVLDFYRNILNHIEKIRISGAKRIAEKVIKCIDENYRDAEFTAGSVSERLSMNQDYLSSILKKELGMPLNKYINNYRLLKAKSYMDQGGCNLTLISEKVGYKDPNYFSKSFKKNFGLAPSAYISGKAD